MDHARVLAKRETPYPSRIASGMPCRQSIYSRSKNGGAPVGRSQRQESQACCRTDRATSICDETTGFFGMFTPMSSLDSSFLDRISNVRILGSCSADMLFHLNQISGGAGEEYRLAKSFESRAREASDSNTSSIRSMTVSKSSAVATAPVSKQWAAKDWESAVCSIQTLNSKRGRWRSLDTAYLRSRMSGEICREEYVVRDFMSRILTVLRIF